MATLALNIQGLDKIRKLLKIDTDVDLARRIGVEPSQVSRILTGKNAPGTKFIAGLLSVTGVEWFEDLFNLVPDDSEAPGIDGRRSA